jgi:Family of unknown function (DUF5678)
MKPKAKELARPKGKKPMTRKSAQSAPNGHSRQGFRDVENEWLSKHPEELRKCAGEYVIIEGTEIIAHGTEPAKLYKIAKRRGIKIPFIFFVPPPRPKNVYWIGP